MFYPFQLPAIHHYSSFLRLNGLWLKTSKLMLNMKWKAIVIMFIILSSLIPAYSINRYLLRMLRPKESLSRLFIYLLSSLLLVFVYTLVLVLLIKMIFPGA
jgi:uncharacterized membrane protein YidH (DUF202 family)